MNVLDYELLGRYERKKKTKLTLQEGLVKLPEGERRQLLQNRIADIERDQYKLMAALFVAGIDVDASDMPDNIAIREHQQRIRENKNLTYYRVCRVRCKCCGDVLEHVNRTKTDNYLRMFYCTCGKVGLDPAACMYRIIGNPDDYEDLSEEWKD